MSRTQRNYALGANRQQSGGSYIGTRTLTPASDLLRKIAYMMPPDPRPKLDEDKPRKINLKTAVFTPDQVAHVRWEMERGGKRSKDLAVFYGVRRMYMDGIRGYTTHVHVKAKRHPDPATLFAEFFERRKGVEVCQ